MRRHNGWWIVKGFGVAMAAAAVVLFFVSGSPVGAVSILDPNSGLGLTSANLIDTVIAVVRWVLGLLALVAVIFIIYGGFVWLTSGGDTAKIDTAKKIILNAVIGLAITLLSFAITYFVINLINDTTNGNNNTNDDPPGGGGELPNAFVLKWYTPRGADATDCVVQLGFNRDPQLASLEGGFSVVVENGAAEGEACADNNDCASDLCASNTCSGRKVSGVYSIVDGTGVGVFAPSQKFSLATVFVASAQGGGLGGIVAEDDGTALSETTRWTFTTANTVDETPPRVERMAPSDGAGNVARQCSLQVEFSKNMLVSTLMDASAITLQNNAGLAFTKYIEGAKYFSATPDTAYGANETQSPLLDSDVITDTCGLFLDGDNSGDEHPDFPDPSDSDGNGSRSTWTFQTGDALACTPQITSVIPNPGSYDDSYRGAGSLRISGGNFGLFGEVTLANNVIIGPETKQCMGDQQAARGIGTRLCIVNWQDNGIVLSDPPSSGGGSNGAISGDVRVSVGGNDSNPQDEEMQSPYIQRVDPNSGPAGTFVTLSGSQFGDATGRTYLRKESDPAFKQALSSDLCNVWDDHQLVIVIPDGTESGDDYYLQVETSAGRFSNGARFTVNTDALAPGICPGDLACGSIGDSRTLVGRFTAKDGNDDTVLINAQDITDANISEWNDASGRITFTMNELLREGGNEVRIQDNGLKSNALTFESPCDKTFCDEEPLTQQCNPSPGLCGGNATCNPSTCECTLAPYVIEDGKCDPEGFPSPNPREDSSEVCVNARVHALFSENMKDSTLNAQTIIVEECNAADQSFDASSCRAAVGSPSIQIGNYGLPVYEGFTLDPEPNSENNFNRNRWYRVRLTTGILAESGFGLQQEYAWKFRTKDSSDPCEVERVDIEPGNHTFRDGQPLEQEFYTVESGAFCQLLDTTGEYTWRLEPQGPPYSLTPSDVTARVQTTRDDGQTTLIGKTGVAEGTSMIRSEFSVVSCETSDDCKDGSDKLGNACSNSECVNNICTPDITTILPNDGAVNDFVSVHGCYFGAYQDNVSKVEFSALGGRVKGVLPTDLCSDQYVWDTQEVRVRVPSGAITGRVVLTAASHPSQPATSDQDFTINADQDLIHYACLEPHEGPRGTEVTIHGERFGADAGDVVFKKTNLIEAVIDSWNDTKIQALVNYDTELGVNQTFVQRLDGVQSSQIPFEVFTGGGESAPCSDVPETCQPNNTHCNTGLTCNVTSCVCESDGLSGDENPEIRSKNPEPSEDNVCRNRVVEIVFDQVMDRSTLTTSNIRLIRTHGDGECIVVAQEALWDRLKLFARSIFVSRVQASHLRCAVEYDLSTQTIADETHVILDPNDLLFAPPDAEMNYRVIVNGGSLGVKGTNGLQLAESDVPVDQVAWDFRTKDALCDLSAIQTYVTLNTTDGPQTAESASDLFTCSRDTCTDDLDVDRVGNQHDYDVRGYTSEGDPLGFGEGDGELSGLWDDTDLPDDVTAFSGDAERVVSTVDQNRSSGVENATVSVTQNTTNIQKESDFTIQLNQCDDPWPKAGPFPYFGADDAQFEDYHFQSMYCKDDMADPITVLDYPDEFYESSPNDTDELLAEFYLRSPNLTGTVGILIYENEQRLSAEGWFAKRFPGKQAGRATLIGGYPAVESEDGTYISFSNFGDSDELFANIMVVEHSVDAGEALRDIYRQILSNMTYNTNMTTENKSKISRDLVRINDLSDAAQATYEYRTENQMFPDLVSGSFLNGHSTSKWPQSWSLLSNTLGTTLNRDPSNAFNLPSDTCSEQRGYDVATCWNESEKRFFCPNGSHLYHYQVGDDPKFDASYFGALEYTDTGSWVNALDSNPCRDIVGSSCSCYNYRVNVDENGFDFGGAVPF